MRSPVSISRMLYSSFSKLPILKVYAAGFCVGNESSPSPGSEVSCTSVLHCLCSASEKKFLTKPFQDFLLPSAPVSNSPVIFLNKKECFQQTDKCKQHKTYHTCCIELNNVQTQHFVYIQSKCLLPQEFLPLSSYSTSKDSVLKNWSWLDLSPPILKIIQLTYSYKSI